MLLIKNDLFNDKYVILEDDNDVINNLGVMNSDWEVVLAAQFEKIYDTNLSYAIIAKAIKEDNKDYTYYGILDEKLNIIIDPSSKKYKGDEGYEQILKLINKKVDEAAKIELEFDQPQRVKILKPSLKRKQKK